MFALPHCSCGLSCLLFDKLPSLLLLLLLFLSLKDILTDLYTPLQHVNMLLKQAQLLDSIWGHPDNFLGNIMKLACHLSFVAFCYGISTTQSSLHSWHYQVLSRTGTTQPWPCLASEQDCLFRTSTSSCTHTERQCPKQLMYKSQEFCCWRPDNITY